ncbi:hypothetical protein PFISCL1PPCAC_8744, partial [Pristionchus fissidentatus]
TILAITIQLFLAIRFSPRMVAPSDLLAHVGNDNVHLLRYWDELSTEQRDEFRQQLLSLKFSGCSSAFASSALVTAPSPANLSPVPDERHVVKKDLSNEEEKRLKDLGVDAVSRGEVAVLVLAGGQATRLGCAQPKGMVPLGLQLTECDSLFCLQAGRIDRLQKLGKGKAPDSSPHIPWLVMTSRSTQSDTAAHMEAVKATHGMGGEKGEGEQVMLFSQEDIPAFDTQGKLLLAAKNKVATAPNGNGGLYSALHPLLDQLTALGVKYVHVYCVDNVLVKVADPLMVGLAIDKGADCIAKAVKREDPSEKVGVICMNEGKPTVVEYSELGELAQRSLPDGRLEYRAGNIANHLFALDFLKSFITPDFHLPYHRAEKKIAFVNEEGETEKPTSPNGIKLEQFVFDVFEKSKNFYIMEVERKEEFSPLKNPDSAGTDCLTTCRRDIYNAHAGWLVKAGATVGEGVSIRVKPSRSYDGENLEEFGQMRIDQDKLIC